MTRELYTAAHDELIGEYLERHPSATEAQAYDATVNAVSDRARDNYASMIDYTYQQAKDKRQ